jgi:hypothetical protein
MGNINLEGDSLSSIVTIKYQHFFSDWASATVISDAHDFLLSILVWSA